MKTIKLKNSDIEQKRMIVEYINWICPYCNKKNRDSEFGITYGELWCSECKETTKYEWAD